MLEAEGLGASGGTGVGGGMADCDDESGFHAGFGSWLLSTDLLIYLLTDLGRSESSLGNGWKVSPAAPFRRNGVWSWGAGS